MKGREALAAMAALALAVSMSGCSSQDADRSMTDDDIMAAIEQGDADTLAKAKAEVEKAVSDAVSDIDRFTDADKEALKKSIHDDVEKRLSSIESGSTVVNRYVTETYPTYTTKEGDTYVTEENTYVTQGESSKPPRIEDGAPVPASWDIAKSFVDSNGCSYEVNSIEAKAYNFAEDTPYAGGGYAYTIEVRVSGTFKPYEPDDPNQGITQSSGYFLPAKMMFSPYDIELNGTTQARNDYETRTFDNVFTFCTNMLPDSISAVAK